MHFISNSRSVSPSIRPRQCNQGGYTVHNIIQQYKKNKIKYGPWF